MGLKVIKADFNNNEEISKVISENKIDGVLIQYTRQKIEDKYKMEQLIEEIKKHLPDKPRSNR